jgi:hypothetical protein
MRVVSEFTLGDEYSADFLVGLPLSGGWLLHFFELKRADVELFNRSGLPSRHLSRALEQIRCWQRLCLQNRHYLLQQIIRAFCERDLYAPERRGEEPLCSAGFTMTDPACMAIFSYHIVIGRRHDLSKQDLHRKSAFKQTDDVEIATYDRILDYCQTIS